MISALSAHTNPSTKCPAAAGNAEKWPVFLLRETLASHSIHTNVRDVCGQNDVGVCLCVFNLFLLLFLLKDRAMTENTHKYGINGCA